MSFDHPKACKRCGADLTKVKRHSGIPTLTALPVGPPPSRSALPAGPSAEEALQKPEDQGRQIDALFADLSDSQGLAVTAEQEPREKSPFRLDLETLPPLRPAPGGPPSATNLATDVTGQLKVDILPKAGFWIRLLAWIADIVCLFLSTIVLALLVLATIWFGGWLSGEINEQVMALAGYSSAIIVMASRFLYFTLFVGARGQTPGKMLFGLKIVPVNDQEMTYGRECLRSLCWTSRCYSSALASW